MIKILVRGFGALSLTLVPLLSAPAAQAAPAAEVTTLADAVGLVAVTVEDRTGYTRSSFKHWNSGEDASDGCNTRAEVLLAEAVVAPTVGAGFKLTGGTWVSYYDGQKVTSARSLDIDHTVPLAEAWDSGASSCEFTAADFPIWHTKQYQQPPRLAPGDGPIGPFRRWARRFYPQLADGPR
ncbi:hypothetical protein ACFW6N_34835 [Streptomyces cyaneofuscatus]|uniref:hypothetical protein n=1 Tax=Streptomyces cyaneofuscatus TaxID=66883 RepID=UPI00367BFEDD